MKLMDNLKSSKALIVASSLAVANSAFAATTTTGVAFDSSTKSFTGTFDLSPYYSAIGITVAAIAIVASIALAIKSFKRI